MFVFLSGLLNSMANRFVSLLSVVVFPESSGVLATYYVYSKFFLRLKGKSIENVNFPYKFHYVKLEFLKAKKL